MSNRLSYDPLLVHHLAIELDRELRGRACAAAPLFAEDGSATLPFQGDRALRLDLHPSRGWVRIVLWHDQGDELDAICTGITSLPDERLITLSLRTADRFRVGERHLVVELHTNQWNALLLNADDRRILTVLRARRAGARSLRPGATYEPPPPNRRYGTTAVSESEAFARWTDLLGALPPAERRPALLRHFAATGSVNADPILGEATSSADPRKLREAFTRWWALLQLESPSPVILHLPAGGQPYPAALSGIQAEPVTSLLAGMARVAAEERSEQPATVATKLVLQRLDARVSAIERKIERLLAQRADPGEIEALRAQADLLLSNLRLVPHGADRVRLMGWDRKIVEIQLEPTLTGAENARRIYAEAKRRARADERLPALIAAAEDELRRWRGFRAAAEQGEVPEAVLEELERSGTRAESGSGDTEETRPYRVYRTSGGIEVRVGRNARSNDRLTFGHSSPNDVWLHARSVAGSHVILRWGDPEGAPPARDLEEAATLAALYSKARTSALVPVDWTRRKHVRKPRGAPAGAVIPQRVKTLFVSPDEELDERLRE